MRVFVETSALVKRYVRETGSVAMDDMVAFVEDSGGDLLISNLVALEVVGCFAKKLRSGKIDRPDYTALAERFEIDYHDLFQIVRLIDDRSAEAFTLSIGEPDTGISAADRLHVVAAVDGKFAAPAQPTAFVTCDRALYGYVKRKGLRPWDPERDGMELLVKIGAGRD